MQTSELFTKIESKKLPESLKKYEPKVCGRHITPAKSGQDFIREITQAGLKIFGELLDQITNKVGMSCKDLGELYGKVNLFINGEVQQYKDRQLVDDTNTLTNSISDCIIGVTFWVSDLDCIVNRFVEKILDSGSTDEGLLKAKNNFFKISPLLFNISNVMDKLVVQIDKRIGDDNKQSVTQESLKLLENSGCVTLDRSTCNIENFHLYTRLLAESKKKLLLKQSIMSRKIDEFVQSYNFVSYLNHHRCKCTTFADIDFKFWYALGCYQYITEKGVESSSVKLRDSADEKFKLHATTTSDKGDITTTTTTTSTDIEVTIPIHPELPELLNSIDMFEAIPITPLPERLINRNDTIMNITSTLVGNSNIDSDMPLIKITKNSSHTNTDSSPKDSQSTSETNEEKIISLTEYQISTLGELFNKLTFEAELPYKDFDEGCRNISSYINGEVQQRKDEQLINDANKLKKRISVLIRGFSSWEENANQHIQAYKKSIISSDYTDEVLLKALSNFLPILPLRNQITEIKNEMTERISKRISGNITRDISDESLKLLEKSGSLSVSQAKANIVKYRSNTDLFVEAKTDLCSKFDEMTQKIANFVRSYNLLSYLANYSCQYTWPNKQYFKLWYKYFEYLTVDGEEGPFVNKSVPVPGPSQDSQTTTTTTLTIESDKKTPTGELSASGEGKSDSHSYEDVTINKSWNGFSFTEKSKSSEAVNTKK